jgi:uncharacterized protein (TIRG00374 family)
MNKSRSFLRLTQLIGVAMFIVIVANIDVALVLAPLRSLRLEWLALYVLFFALSLLAKILRWNVVLKAQRAHLTRGRVASIALVASFLGSVTPGRVGEVSKIAYLQQEQMSLAKAAVSVVLDRLYDIAFLCLFGVIGMAYFSSYFLPDIEALIFVAVLVSVMVVFVFLLRRRIWDLMKALTRRIVSTETYNGLAQGWDVFRSELIAASRRTMWAMAGYSIVAHGFFFGQIYVLALGFGLNLPFIYVSLCLALSSLVALLPISIGGLGTREAIFIGLLGKISVPPESALLLSFTDGVVLGLSLAALSALIASWYLKKQVAL